MVSVRLVLHHRLVLTAGDGDEIHKHPFERETNPLGWLKASQAL